jgi:endonuclease/exonuclease/phosphatase family metal-dependent hydrolase
MLAVRGAGAVLVAALLALTGCTRAEPPRAPELTLVSWNLQGFLLTAGVLDGAPDDARTIAGYLRSTGADYVGLQEISVAHARAIAGQLGWGTDERHVRTAFEHGGTNGQYAEGIAMLSRYPITDYAEIPLRPVDIPAHPDGRGRKLQFASITADGAVFHVYNTHLASSDWTCSSCGAFVPGADNDVFREKQARFLRDLVDRRERGAPPGTVLVVGGDMNTHPIPAGKPTLAYRTLSARFADTWAALHPTANTDPPCTADSGCTILIRDDRGAPQPPFRRVDYFFVEPAARPLVRSARTPPPEDTARFAPFSDHFPYQVTIAAR